MTLLVRHLSSSLLGPFQRAGWWWQLAFPNWMVREREKRRDKKTNTNLDGNWNAFCYLILEVKTTILLVTLAKHGTLWEMTLRGVTARRWGHQEPPGLWLLCLCCLFHKVDQKLVSLIVVAPLLHSKSFSCIQPGLVDGEEGGRGDGMGNTCKSMADLCQCMAKTTTIL